MTMYLINALLVLLVVRQVREHQLDARALAVRSWRWPPPSCSCTRCPPAAATSRWTWRAPRPARPWARPAAWPSGCARAPAAAGRAGPESWRRPCGSPAPGPGWPAASPPPRGAGPAIAAVSIAHHITGPAAWTAALVMMALADVTARLVTVYPRGRRLTATPVAATAAPAGAGA